jgi:ribonuclease P protein component
MNLNLMELKNGFPKGLRLLRPGQFQKVFEQGRRKSGPFLLIVFVSNQLSLNRFGISVGRKFGGAVRRNWFKRQVREAVRKLPREGGGWDVVICPKSKVEIPQSARLDQEISRLFNQLKHRNEIAYDSEKHAGNPQGI